MIAPELLKLVSIHLLEIMEKMPTAFVILIDLVGEWDFSQFKVVWANSVAKQLMPHETLDTLIVPSDATMNAVISNFKMVKTQTEEGETGFFGPYPYTTVNSDGDTVHLEFNIMLLGKHRGSNVFLVMSQDKTAEVFSQRMEASGHIPRKGPFDILSDRERSVGILIVRGLSTKQIAKELGVSERTVDNHRGSIRKKSNLTDRTISISQHLRNS